MQGLAPYIASLIACPGYVPLQRPHLGYVFNFPWTFGKLDLSWLVDLPKWWYPQLQQHSIVLAIAHTLLRHSSDFSSGEFTCSWQESFTVEQVLKEEFFYSFTKIKKWYHTHLRYKNMSVSWFGPGLDWHTISRLGYCTIAFLYP